MNNCSIGLIHMFKVRLIAFISRQQTRIYDKLLWQFANIFSLLRGKPRLCGPANTQCRDQFETVHSTFNSKSTCSGWQQNE